jgi:hypothetical protein
MDFLYVCHFSNGLIKIGRSVDPMARIASHEDRLACAGIFLVEHQIAECFGASIPAEATLIARCVEAASKRHLEEWFEGLDYAEVCGWAMSAAAMRLEYPPVNSRWRVMLGELKRAGMTQMQIAQHCRCDQSTISALSNGRAEEPRHTLGERIIALHADKVAA